MNALLDKPETVVPSHKDTELATASSRLLSTKLRSEGELRVRLPEGEELVLPQAAARLLTHILTEMSHGNAVTLIPVHAEFTTQEAADYLNVSRPFLIGLLEKGAVKYRKVGTHRRIMFRDLQAFKEHSEKESAAALGELAAQAQELGMGY